LLVCAHSRVSMFSSSSFSSPHVYFSHRYLHSFPTRRSSDLKPRQTEISSETSRLQESGKERSCHVPSDPKHQQRDQDPPHRPNRSEEHTSELQSRFDLVCRLLLEKKKRHHNNHECTVYIRYR